MRRILIAILTIIPIIATGCGGEPANLLPTPAPNGGGMTRLPNNAGLVAIKTEGPSGKTKSKTARIVAYFYQNDGKTALSPAPTDVVFKLDERDKSATVPLLADTTDPNKFSSAPGPYAAGVSGNLSAKVDGQEISESFSSR